MLDFFINNLEYIIIGIIAVILILLIVFYPTKVKQVLLLYISKAEEEYGSGTGYLKLKDVYDKFSSRFPIISFFIPFSIFSKIVDMLLEGFREVLETNTAVSAKIEGETDEAA
jgi:hypothetical protein